MTPWVTATEPLGVSLAWALTAALSPRPSVRVPAVDAVGTITNSYTGTQPVTGPEPDRPWAIYLADQAGRYRLLVFDLDAKTPQAEAAATADAATIASLLAEAGISHVVCRSGPSGGRHVWVALADSIDPDTTATLARLTQHLCPTLDLAPLTNPTTGCVRPPGAPHRGGGSSVILSGDLDALTQPAATSAQVRLLVSRLARLVTLNEVTNSPSRSGPLPLDDHAHLYLPGPKRPLPAPSAAALAEEAAKGDASHVLWRILIGAASAHWHEADIAALVPTAPGLEHVRTYRDGAHRRPRPQRGHQSPTSVLRHHWKRAVRYVAATTRQIGDDPTFDTRAGDIADLARNLQMRADASPGRWAHGGGPADRRVLDVLCIFALQAVRADVEADIRRLGLLAGIGRETARTALLRLNADGWITRSTPGDGPHGAHWTIGPQFLIHNDVIPDRSQAETRPEGAGSAERLLLIEHLAGRCASAGHDLFTRAGLGLHAGNVYARMTNEPQDIVAVERLTGTGVWNTARTLNRLTSIGVLERERGGWRRTMTDQRDSAAKREGVGGVLKERGERYGIEREAWAWWRAEAEWMRAPRRRAGNRRPGRGQGQLFAVPGDGTSVYGTHPRGGDGRADYREARRIIVEDRGGRAAIPRVRRRSVDSAKELAASEVPSAAVELILDVLGDVMTIEYTARGSAA